MASQDGLFGRALLCHPVLKFSHSTLPRHATPSAWNHIQGPEIFALIEQLDHDCLQLRVVQGTKDLEALPLTAIVQETRDLHKKHPHLPPDNLPIFGLTKGTALAVRYFCQDNQIRRIQLRFANDDSCNEAVKILSSHGLMFSVPTVEQQKQPQARPSTANSYMSRLSSVQPARFDRDTSSIIVPTVQDTFHPASSYPQHHSDQHITNQGSPSNMHMFTSSPTGKEYQTRDIERQPTDQAADLRMFTSSPTPKVYQTQNIQRQPTFAPVRTSEEPENRPSTAPIHWPSDMTRDLLPPRRELPFPKPSSSPAKTKMLPPLAKPSYVSEASKPAKAEKEKEAKTRSSPERHPSIRPGITRLETPQGPTRFEPPASRMYNFHPNDDEMAVDSGVQMFSDKNTGTVSSETSPGTVANLDWYRSSASPVQFGSTSTDTMSSGPRINMSPSPEQNSYSSPEQMDLSSPSDRRSQRLAQKHDQPQSEMQDIEMTTTIAQQQPAQNDLGRYAEQPDEVRMEAMNQFILANIEDDAFMKLCVDVESCWRRFALDRRG
ncbi:hypothetical protein D6C85_08332 [Aureobasidium pullulans]|uniref:Uncharacterized protein n=1 Tax=Aureobasidium pullulans TaxID=5580 RepID=A0A4S9WJW2_AURPU|nr:hypothetical protein D6C85_08332 [Aureobasidium pullulans]